MKNKKSILKKYTGKGGPGMPNMGKIGVGMGKGKGLENRSEMGLEKGVGTANKPTLPSIMPAKPVVPVKPEKGLLKEKLAGMAK